MRALWRDAPAAVFSTPEDAAGPYVASVPADYGEKARLERLSYTSVPEMLAERFHMDEAFLKALNPDANFNRPGTIIRVANVGPNVATEVTRITRKHFELFDDENVFAVDPGRDIFAERGISPDGAIVIVRPDQYVSYVLPLGSTLPPLP